MTDRPNFDLFVPIERCESMPDIRRNIDRIDAQLVTLLAERLCYITQAAYIKENKEDIRVPSRIEDIIKKVRGLAEKQNLSPDIVENVWRVLMENCIEHEMKEFLKRTGQSA